MSRPVLAVAHRAGNTPEGLRAALDAGADVLETDVHLRRGRLEVRHHKSAGPLPWYWDRTAGGGVPLLQDRWHVAHRSQFPLLLPEVLEAAGAAEALMLDLKGVGSVAPAVARQLHEQAPEVPLLVCARWWPSVDAFRRVPGVRRVLSARSRADLARLRRRLRSDAPYGVSVHRSLLDRAVVSALHERVERVMTWPVDDTQALAEVVDIGVTGVITADPQVLGEVVALR